MGEVSCPTKYFPKHRRLLSTERAVWVGCAAHAVQFPSAEVGVGEVASSAPKGRS